MSCDGGMKGSRHRQQNEFIYSVLFRIRPCVFLITLQMKKLQFLDKERRTKARIWQKKVFADVAGIYYFLEKHTRFLFRHDLYQISYYKRQEFQRSFKRFLNSDLPHNSPTACDEKQPSAAMNIMVTIFVCGELVTTCLVRRRLDMSVTNNVKEYVKERT